MQIPVVTSEGLFTAKLIEMTVHSGVYMTNIIANLTGVTLFLSPMDMKTILLFE